MTDNTIRTGADWESRYVSGSDRWTLEVEPPCLHDLLVELDGNPPFSVLVPGAGYGVDALAWARAGHRVTAVDIAPLAVSGMLERAQDAGVELTALEADLFDLPSALRGTFDVVWEQTCFCAIRPTERAAYVDAMHGTLKPAGLFYGLFWNHGAPDGPPWTISEQEVRDQFAAHFEILALDHVAASAPRRSNEFLARMRPRADA